MEFANPWGLLALLSLPAIVGLHYFHSQQRHVVVGGLHLWDFARMQMPVGGKFDRLIRNSSLLFQLLAALLFSLLIAGMDFPQETRTRHFTVILDDSISMQAGERKTSADRAREALVNWSRPNNRYTLIAAGARPRVIAGPFANHDDLLAALESWNPTEVTFDIEAAINLASKFSTDSGKALVYTDDESAGRAFVDAVEVAAVGDNFDNAAIDYAERMRSEPLMDRIVVTVKAYSRARMSVDLTATINNEPFMETTVDLEPMESKSITFDTDRIHDPVDIKLEADGFPLDGEVNLSPVSIKTVRVARVGLEPISAQLEKAINALPYTRIVNSPNTADLVFATAGSFTPSHGNLRVVYIPDPLKADPSGAEGRDLVVSRRDIVTRNLSLEGIVWGFDTQMVPMPEDLDIVPDDLITWRGFPILSRISTEHGAEYHLNMLTDRTNIFRNIAWPVLVSGIVEETRGAIPGLTRTNFRLGESVSLNIKQNPDELKKLVIRRDGVPFGDYEEIPEVLPELGAGVYTVHLGEEQVGRFTVNLFAPEESDLRALSAKKPDFGQLVPDEVARREKSIPLFFLLLLLAITFTAGSWISQDLSR